MRIAEVDPIQSLILPTRMIDIGFEFTVRSLSDAEQTSWDDYVTQFDDGTFFHLAGWRRVIEEEFGYACHYVYCERDKEIVGVLPLVHFRNPLAGNTLVSTPFLVYGGPIGNDDRVIDALVNHARELADKLEVDHLELRNRHAIPGDWETNDLYVAFEKEISGDTDANLLAIPRKQRAIVRKGIKGGLVADDEVDLDRFYRVFSESYRNLGTPVFSKSLFRRLFEVFSESCLMTTISKDQEPLSGVLSFVFRDTVVPYYGGGTSRARQYAANDFLYWSVMNTAAQRGLRRFDYGRSKIGTGSYRFKKHWGFEPSDLHYQYSLVKSKEVPNLSPSNPKFATAINLWKKLPVGLSRVMGPPVARWLG